jgi:hypothetical protein
MLEHTPSAGVRRESQTALPDVNGNGARDLLAHTTALTCAVCTRILRTVSLLPRTW